MTNVTQQYLGFIHTPPLWHGVLREGLHQLPLASYGFNIQHPERFNEKRLGKRVEQFLRFQLQHLPEYSNSIENIQIRKGKQTIGELDMLVIKMDILLHIEVVYKFYLFDRASNTLGIDAWIGPNKKDSLRYKLDKLIHKQLPLLYTNEAKDWLITTGINTLAIQQFVCFKAQLFLPFTLRYQPVDCTPLNTKCVYGYYLNIEDIETLKAYQFYIPKKLDWLIDTHLEVPWLPYQDAYTYITKEIEQQRSTMVWLRRDGESLLKAFITWW